MNYRHHLTVGLVVLALSCSADTAPEKLAAAGDDGSGHTAPTEQTIRANAEVLKTLPFDDLTDFDLAKRGFIGARKDPKILDAKGNVVWNLDDYRFETGDAPASVNPSLWRQAKLNSIHGLFKVAPRIYQVRGYDLANMTLVEGDTGWIVIDVMTTEETARAAMDLVREHSVASVACFRTPMLQRVYPSLPLTVFSKRL
jgi:alkyl sulfatase BDS1-like metallo-beta-lactamase superfamily hydrolase